MRVKINSKVTFGTQPSGPYREVVSVQRSKSIAKLLLGPNQVVYREVVSIQRSKSSFWDQTKWSL